MLPILALMAAGAIAGAATNKQNPMKGALMGAGIGATGGLLAPAGAAAAGAAEAGAAGGAGLLGSAGSAAGAAGASGAGAAGLLGDATAAGYGGLGASSASSLGGGAAVNGGAALGSEGLLGSGLMGKLKMAGDAASSAGNVMSAVKAVSPQQQPIQASPYVAQPSVGPQSLSAIAAQGQQLAAQQLSQAEQMRRQRRAGLLGMS